jgi:hypothetical protein
MRPGCVFPFLNLQLALRTRSDSLSLYASSPTFDVSECRNLMFSPFPRSRALKCDSESAIRDPLAQPWPKILPFHDLRIRPTCPTGGTNFHPQPSKTSPRIIKTSPDPIPIVSNSVDFRPKWVDFRIPGGRLASRRRFFNLSDCRSLYISRRSPLPEPRQRKRHPPTTPLPKVIQHPPVIDFTSSVTSSNLFSTSTLPDTSSLQQPHQCYPVGILPLFPSRPLPTLNSTV